MIKGVLFDLDKTLVDERENLITGVPRLLIELEELGLSIAVLTNQNHKRAERILRGVGIGGTPVFSRQSVGKQKMSGALHEAAAAHLGLSIQEVVAVGDSRQDSLAAINAKVLPLGATWGGGDPPYAIQVNSPEGLLVVLKSFFLHEPRWYWKAEGQDTAGRTVSMRALLQAGDAWQRSMYSLLKRVVKFDAEVKVEGVDFRDFLYLYTLANAYMDGLLTSTDIWTEYPASSAATVRQGLAKLAGPASLLFRDQHDPDLIERHTRSKKSASLRASHYRTGGGELPKFTGQTNTIRLNGSTKIEGKVVLLFDDFITEGHSTEAARNYLLEGGAAQVNVVVVGRFGSSWLEARAPREGLTFDPYSANEFEESDFDRISLQGTYDREALDLFIEKWNLHNELVGGEAG